ncbi:retinal guanylyl cyclase 2 [Alosa pseudoharengus]|uniref:retinal guanylyl cyclase 2 n=1 Tax=Alosa pseudoharengus TaxID=34774 RepID=UPI003F8A625E
MQHQLCAFHSNPQTWPKREHLTPDHPLPSSTPHLECKPGLLWLLLILVSLVPSMSHAAAVFRVGVVGPWNCDPIFAKTMPAAAAQLAVSRINRDALLSKIATFDYVILEEDCETSHALRRFLHYYTRAAAFIGPANPGYWDAASLLGKNWGKAMFSWACVGSELDELHRHPNFACTVPLPTLVLLSVMRHFRWAHVGIISSADDIWVETASKLANALRGHGLPVGIVASVGNDPDSMRKTLAKVKKMEELRMVVLCMHSVLIGGQVQKLVLETAHDMRLTDGSLMFVPYDTLLYSLPYMDVPHPALRNNSKLLRAYDAVLTITVQSQQHSFYQAYQQAVDSGELPSNIKPQQVSPLFGTIYNSILYLAHTMKHMRDSGKHIYGGNLVSHARSVSFQGFSHPVRSSTSGAGLLDFVILDTDGLSWELRPTHRVEMELDMVRYLGKPIHFPNGVAPKTDAGCWFTHSIICSAGVDPFAAVIMAVFTFLVFLCFAGIYYFIRRKISQISLVRGPNRILLTLDDVTFINPSLSNKKFSIQDDSRANSVRKSSSDRSLKSHFSSQSPATYENSNVAVYEGEWAWLKRLPHGDFKTITPGTSDVFGVMKELRHENVNSFLGFFHDCGVFAIMTEYCTRGSLEDLLINDDVPLDWMFKSSLIMDLIKGMKYLHYKNVCHGRLKSRNCLVDGRFVLKVTDYGYKEVLEEQKFPYEEPPAEDLLWTAPEILRGPSPGHHGSFPGDVYSFAIITQEVVMRGLPYCMLELSAEDIVERIRRPPPLCRPEVTSGYAPVECIQLMKQCWSEEPDKRPTFGQVFDQFKNINKGKKTNIIDSMLRMLEQYSSNLEELIRDRTAELEVEKLKTEKLLTQMLPPSVAESLKLGYVEPVHFDSVSVYFSDIVGFTTISANLEPIEVVEVLNDLYSLFDAVIANHDVYKVETIGDAYMVSSGCPVPNGNRHAAEIANMALDILSAVDNFKMKHMPEVPLRIRIGIHTGSCVAGVVGLTMPRYCLFGDTITTASRMESTGMPHRIHIHNSTVQILLSLKQGYKVELRGKIELKNKIPEETYWLIGKDGFTKPLPGTGTGQKDLKLLLHKAVRKISTVRQVALLGMMDEGNVMMHHH